ncbi:MAG: IS200/IS605 family transposase [Syntrophaceae bacterium]|nr:IS200/IS605 family transposase [Syntrophaceae bacterium]
MAIRRTAHAVYDTRYHFVWAPKYRKWIKREDIRDRVKEVFGEVAERHEFEIQEVRVAPDHVHIFLSFPPRYSISHVVGVLKSITVAVVFEEFPEVKKEWWGGEFLGDGYFVRMVGDKVTADLIRRYIRYHRDEIDGKQLKLF